MDKKSKILITIFLLLVFVSTTAAYYRYMILRDFEVINVLAEEPVNK